MTDNVEPILEDNTEIDEEETIEISADDLQAILESIESLEDEMDIEEKIERTLFENRNIYLQGEIDENTPAQICPMIHFYNISDNKNGIAPENRMPIQLYVNSVGGALHQSNVIVAAIEASETPIHTISQGGVGMSAGLNIFLSGHVKYMSRHSNLMYHQLSAGVDGTFADMQNQITHYASLQDGLDEYVVERTDIPMEKLKYYRERNLDWHINFKEAQKYNMFDEVI